MKTKWIIAVILFVSTSIVASAQDERKVELKVNMEEINGEKTLTIEKNENGHVTKEVYKNEEAEAKLAELESNETMVKEEVVVEKEFMSEEDAEKAKKVIIRTEENGKVTEEIYTGEDAEIKMKELKSEEKDKERHIMIKKTEKVVE